MDDFIKNLKKKLSVDNIVDQMKEAKVIDEQAIKEQDVRNTLSKIDPNNMMDVDEIALKLKELSDQSKYKQEETKSQSSKVVDAAKASFSVIQKFTKSEDQTEEIMVEYPYIKEDNVFNLYDDFN
ncbi:uncharacterized protein LOC131841923 [Achroia grisella]|uniref:uncharacterized protein LOC131841923 n=1 Tax=Achroia grisella TaxID=688607 RepID=UPI0027D22BDE|nr:uncharacterized protein LOC131841923 [Achroia grisella]